MVWLRLALVLLAMVALWKAWRVWDARPLTEEEWRRRNFPE